MTIQRNLAAAIMALEHIAADEAELRAKMAELAPGVGVWRELAQQAIHSLHELSQDRDRLRQRYHALLDERRRNRVLDDATLMPDAIADPAQAAL